MIRRTALCWLAMAFLACCRFATAQTFQFRIQQGTSVLTVTDGSSVSMAAEALGRVAVADLTATYSGTSGATVTAVVVGGSADFSLTSATRLPQSVMAGQSLSFGIRFQPTTSARALAQLYIHYLEAGTARFATLNLAGTTPDFLIGYVIAPDNNFIPLSSGGTLAFTPTGINSSSAATVVIVNRGSGAGQINAISAGGVGFQLQGLPPMPVAVEAGRELRIGVVYTPRQTGSHSGVLNLSFPDRVFPVQLAASTAGPDFAITYYLQADGNAVAIEPGGKLVYPPTKVNATASAVVAVSNRGAGGGYLNQVAVMGKGFQLTGVAPLPILVEPGKELRFGVTYSPQEVETAAGVLRLVIDERTVLVNLEGSASGQRFTYLLIRNGSVSTFSANETLALPDTPLRETTNAVVQIRNLGNADGTITAISLTGPGFQVTNLPILPYTLGPNTSVSFNLTFTPTQPGAASGRLRIGTDSFELIGSGLGSKLQYSYVSGNARVEILETRTILWGPVQIGQSAQIELLVRNTGTSAATLASVSIVDARSAFRLADAVELPVIIQPGSELVFPLLFSPTAIGDNTTRLRVEAETLTLVGSGTAPPSLPAIEFRGPGQTLDPMQQPALSMVLASPYPLALTGTLTLSVNSTSFSVDPAVQFATGGRTVAFTIPANETAAQFPTGSEIRFQTGTVAGSISFSASFSTQSGINITPDTPSALSVSIPATAPRVLDIQLGARSTNGFAVVVTGLSTTRSLAQLELQFASSPKFRVPTGQFTLNIDSASSAWYRTAESQAYGSLFTASIPFTFQNQDSSLNLDEVFQSISATLINEKGRSNTLSVTPHQ